MPTDTMTDLEWLAENFWVPCQLGSYGSFRDGDKEYPFRRTCFNSHKDTGRCSGRTRNCGGVGWTARHLSLTEVMDVAERKWPEAVWILRSREVGLWTQGVGGGQLVKDNQDRTLAAYAALRAAVGGVVTTATGFTATVPGGFAVSPDCDIPGPSRPQPSPLALDTNRETTSLFSAHSEIRAFVHRRTGHGAFVGFGHSVSKAS